MNAFRADRRDAVIELRGSLPRRFDVDDIIVLCEPI